MRDRTCCFTGHRKIPSEQYTQIARRLRCEIVKLIEQGYVFFGTGGALGFDTLAAQTVLELRESYPQIKLILVLPCKNQTHGWDAKDIAIYEEIKKRCDKFVYTSEQYDPCCMFKRNRHLVNNSSVCICFQTENKGGTAYTVNYARKEGLKVLNLG